MTLKDSTLFNSNELGCESAFYDEYLGRDSGEAALIQWLLSDGSNLVSAYLESEDIPAGASVPKELEILMHELITVAKRTAQLRKPKIVTGKELIVWTVLEFLDTDLAFSDLIDWFNHAPSVEEILSIPGTSILYCLEKGPSFARARLRGLVSKHLSVKNTRKK